MSDLQHIHDSVLETIGKLLEVEEFLNSFEELALSPKDSYRLGQARASAALAMGGLDQLQFVIGRMSAGTFALRGATRSEEAT